VPSDTAHQIVHMTDALGQATVKSAARTLRALNPDVRICCHGGQLSATELDAVIDSADVVVDGTDSFEARFAINGACIGARKPLVSAAVVRTEGLKSKLPF
jgi:molybdopterin/thiamine biosynthesis adenylyltransferase